MTHEEHLHNGFRLRILGPTPFSSDFLDNKLRPAFMKIIEEFKKQNNITDLSELGSERTISSFGQLFALYLTTAEYRQKNNLRVYELTTIENPIYSVVKKYSSAFMSTSAAALVAAYAIGTGTAITSITMLLTFISIQLHLKMKASTLSRPEDMDKKEILQLLATPYSWFVHKAIRITEGVWNFLREKQPNLWAFLVDTYHYQSFQEFEELNADELSNLLLEEFTQSPMGELLALAARTRNNQKDYTNRLQRLSDIANIHQTIETFCNEMRDGNLMRLEMNPYQLFNSLKEIAGQVDVKKESRDIKTNIVGAFLEQSRSPGNTKLPELPIELCAHISPYLELRDCARAAQACKAAYRVVAPAS